MSGEVGTAMRAGEYPTEKMSMGRGPCQTPWVSEENGSDDVVYLPKPTVPWNRSCKRGLVVD